METKLLFLVYMLLCIGVIFVVHLYHKHRYKMLDSDLDTAVAACKVYEEKSKEWEFRFSQKEYENKIWKSQVEPMQSAFVAMEKKEAVLAKRLEEAVRARDGLEQEFGIDKEFTRMRKLLADAVAEKDRAVKDRAAVENMVLKTYEQLAEDLGAK